MNRASKNESASTSGSDREGLSEGSLKHTLLECSVHSMTSLAPATITVYFSAAQKHIFAMEVTLSGPRSYHH